MGMYYYMPWTPQKNDTNDEKDEDDENDEGDEDDENGEDEPVSNSFPRGCCFKLRLMLDLMLDSSMFSASFLHLCDWQPDRQKNLKFSK